MRPAGIDGSTLPGPYGVGAYAAKLREFLRERSRVQLFGEVWNVRVSRARSISSCVMPTAPSRARCGATTTTRSRSAIRRSPTAHGSSSRAAGLLRRQPHVLAVVLLRDHGAADRREGDLLAQLDRLRKALDAEGLFAPQKQLHRPALPRTIGVVTGEGGKARDDILAGLARRGWQGRVVWAFAPVQDRHAAPRITMALQDLAATGAVDVIVVARGGGSLADLFCFCDETLCRTVALLGVPVIASVGHHTDRTLIDDVAALSCSTPTHAAESAVPVHCAEAREELLSAGRRLSVHASRALLHRAQTLARLSRAPGAHLDRERRQLHQRLREIRAAGRRRIEHERGRSATKALVLERKAHAASGDAHAASRLERWHSRSQRTILTARSSAATRSSPIAQAIS